MALQTTKLKLKDSRVLQGAMIFLGLTVVFLSLFGDKGLLQLGSLLSQEKELQAQLLNLRLEKAEWQARAKALRQDSPFWEGLARENLGWVKNGELLILTAE